MRGKSVDLFDVEDGIGFQERNGMFNGFALVVGFGFGEAIGIDDV